jgi:beta-lactamase superfamily II metal-dependent hydrolase
MKKAKKAPAKRRARLQATGEEQHIKVRMYNVGFGDSFLLRIPTDAGERRILVDCGYHTKGKGKFTDQDLVQQIKADLQGQPLNVVVATHRHQDHISGFGEKDLWADISVEEVWLPFTANPEAVHKDPALTEWNALMDNARDLCDAAGSLAPAAISALGPRDADEREAAEFMLWNARTNAPGIENLLHDLKRADGRQSKRRFLPEDKDRYPSRLVTPVLPGVTTFVLGPPTDPKFRKQQKVPSSWGFGDETPGDLGVPGADITSPFSAEWRIPVNQLPPRRPFHDTTLQSIRLFNDDLLYAAKALEGFLNGESLVLVLEVGCARLLLPGDAEVGTWTMIMNNADALELAARATFLKIGHHGSHNATPISFINEHLPRKIPAVISTQEGTGKYRKGIPLDRLLDTMSARSMPYVRSDIPPASQQGIFQPDREGRWIDCFIPCQPQRSAV